MLAIELFEEMAVNDLTLIDALRDFLPIAVDHLKLPGIPKITLERSIEKSNVPTFGRFTNADDHVYVAIQNRNPNDILRTLAHELCHFKQRTEHELSGGSWHTGSPSENQAHEQAGIIMREFNSKFPQYLRMKPVILPGDAEGKHIDEAWTKKYKKSINCSNPKGFSQKAHCAARRARQAGRKTKSKSVSEARSDFKLSPVIAGLVYHWVLSDYAVNQDHNEPEIAAEINAHKQDFDRVNKALAKYGYSVKRTKKNDPFSDIIITHLASKQSIKVDEYDVEGYEQYVGQADRILHSMMETKDACYNKVKSRYKVWPSAYASGALSKCRKVGAKNWGNKSKK